MQQPVSHIIQPPDHALIPWWYLVPVYAVLLASILVLYPAVSPIVIIGGLIVLFVTVYYPEIPLVAFVFIGVTKPWIDENIGLFQTIDYTVFLAAYLFVLLFITMVRRQTYTLPSFLHFLPILLVFSGLLFIGLIHTPAPVYGFEKASRFFIFNIFLFIATIVFISDKKDVYRILTVLIGLSFVLSVIMFYESIHGLLSGDVRDVILRMTILGANPIASARIFALSFLILLIAAYFSERRWHKVTMYLLSGYFLIALIVTNTRGPLFSTFAAVILFALFLSGMKFKTIAAYFGIFIVSVITIFLLLPEFVTSRYEVLLEAGDMQQALHPGEVDTIGSRILMWSMAFTGAVESIWIFIAGQGTGSFASLFHFGDFTWYPHNIIAEIVYELGLIGLLIFSLHIGHIILYTRISWKKAGNDKDMMVILTILIVIGFAAFTGALISGDLTDNRNIWFHFGLIIACWRILTNKLRSGGN